MRVLVTIHKSPTQRFLIKLYTQELISEVKNLINRNKHSQAMSVVFAKGNFEREVSPEELATVDADLILSKNTARWDLMK